MASSRQQQPAENDEESKDNSITPDSKSKILKKLNSSGSVALTAPLSCNNSMMRVSGIQGIGPGGQKEIEQSLILDRYYDMEVRRSTSLQHNDRDASCNYGSYGQHNNNNKSKESVLKMVKSEILIGESARGLDKKRRRLMNFNKPTGDTD